MTEAGETIQVLTFRLSDEFFGVPISRVREVNELSHVTRVPRSPASVRGLLNLRGAVIPVIDLRTKLGFDPTPETIDTCVIVAEVQLAEERALIGALADAVDEVTELDQSALVPPPTLGTQIRADFIRGLARLEERLLMILDLDRLFTGDDIIVPGALDHVSELLPVEMASNPVEQPAESSPQ